MKIEKNKLVKINYCSEEFAGKIIIKETKGLILDTIKVYGYMRHERKSMNECPFYISKDSNITLIIPQEHYDRYIVNATRVVNADIIKIDADDYFDSRADMNGNYEFVLKSNGDTKE